MIPSLISSRVCELYAGVPGSRLTSMRLIALINDPAVLAVLEAVSSRLPEWELLAAWVETDSLRNELATRFPEIPIAPQWDALLTHSCDGVLVAGTSPDVLTACHQLLNLGLPVLVLLPQSGDPSRLFGFTPFWQEYPQQVTPLFVSGIQCAALKLLDSFQAADKGTLWKVEFDRTLPANAAEQNEVSTDLLFLQDLKWVTQLAGTPRHVQMQVSGPENQPAETTITLGSEDNTEVRWRLLHHPHEARWKLSLHGTASESIATGPIETASSNHVSESSETHSLLQEEIVTQLNEWSQAVRSGSDANAPSDWREVIQFAEVGAAARRSLKRWRRIEIHFEDVSERSLFKTQMATLGCGALLWTIFGMIALLTFSELVDPRDREFRKSAAAGFVLSDSEFLPGTSELTEAGKLHLSRVVAEWSSTSPVLIVEVPEQMTSSQGEMRADAILSQLSASGVRNPEERTVFRKIPGRWYPVMITMGWGLVFAPLVVTLLLQLLIFVTRHPFADSQK